MAFSNLFLISCRSISILIVLALGLTFELESFSFRAIFVGLLFSHFAMGFYYSKNNVLQMKEKKFALLIASIVLLIGLYFSVFSPHMAPYFLVIHAALSDAYLLKMKATEKYDELLALLRSLFYVACSSVAFIQMPQTLMVIFLVVGFICLLPILTLTKDKTTLSLFELPLLAVVIYSQLNQTVFHFHYMGFYHIVTWYVFSFWMLFIKEKSPRKTISFFTQVAVLSVFFIVAFDVIFNYTITDQSFLRIIGIWSILHIFSTLSLSKFNPEFLKKIFYPT
jgi:hypothetical protein